MKMAPIMRSYREIGGFDPLLVHTGQHYDVNMSELFFRELGIPEPDLNLGVGSASHAIQTAEIMKAFEPIVLEHRPDAVLVVGDVNSTIACGLVAVKLGVKLVHVEAGLRSFDRGMPEEINRVLTDAISDQLFCTERSGIENLRREGVAEERIHLVGNVMIDTLLAHRERAEQSRILQELRLEEEGYCVLTLHRPSNVDRVEVLSGLLDALEEVQRQLPIVLPAHPRTWARLREFGLESRLEGMPGLRIVDPPRLPGLSEAAVPGADRPHGLGRHPGGDDRAAGALRHAAREHRTPGHPGGRRKPAGGGPIRSGSSRPWGRVLSGECAAGDIPPLWDGSAAARIVEILAECL